MCVNKEQGNAVDRTELRKHIRHVIQRDDMTTVDDLTKTIPAVMDVSQDAVERELDALEREGFIYLVGDRDDDPEVRLP